jgi:hypothetical protein
MGKILGLESGNKTTSGDKVMIYSQINITQDLENQESFLTPSAAAVKNAIKAEAESRAEADSTLQDNIDNITSFKPLSDGVSAYRMGSDTGGGYIITETRHASGAVATRGGVRMSGNKPQLYCETYADSGDGNTPGALTSRSLFEVHSDGLYKSSILSGYQWVKMPEGADLNAVLTSAKSYTDALAVNGVHYRGEVATKAALPTTDREIGDEYLVNNDGGGHSVFAIWDGAEWDYTSTDLSAYRTAAAQDTIDSNKVNKNGTDSLMTAGEHEKLAGIAAGAQVNPGEATTSAAGLMSAEDKTKLDEMEANAGNIIFKVGEVYINV